VLKTNVHVPTDISLLFDATRVMIRICVKWDKQHALPGWRQHQHNLRQFKNLYRKLQKLKHSTSKNEDIKAAKALEIKQAYQDYIDLAGFYLVRVKVGILTLKMTIKYRKCCLLTCTPLACMPSVRSTR
jgi:hypothetical protein